MQTYGELKLKGSHVFRVSKSAPNATDSPVTVLGVHPIESAQAVGCECQRGIDRRKVHSANLQRSIPTLQVAAIIKLISDITFLEVVMAKEFVSPNLLFELFDTLAPVAFPDEVAESSEQLVKLIVVNRRSERHLDSHLATYFLL